MKTGPYLSLTRNAFLILLSVVCISHLSIVAGNSGGDSSGADKNDDKKANRMTRDFDDDEGKGKKAVKAVVKADKGVKIDAGLEHKNVNKFPNTNVIDKDFHGGNKFHDFGGSRTGCRALREKLDELTEKFERACRNGYWQCYGGRQGPPGPQGPQGAPGRPGEKGVCLPYPNSYYSNDHKYIPSPPSPSHFYNTKLPPYAHQTNNKPNY